MRIWPWLHALSIAIGVLLAWHRYHDATTVTQSVRVPPVPVSESTVRSLAAANNTDTLAPGAFFRADVPTLPRAEWAPLPAETLPLAAAYPILKARADQGDPRAACRLSADLHWCAKVLRELQSVLPGEHTKRRQQLDPDSHCSGIGHEQIRERLAYLRQAALAGNLASMEAYVSGDFMTQEPGVAADYFRAYQQEAPRLAEAGVQAGSLPMVVLLERAYGSEAGYSWLSRAQSRRFDPAREALLRLLALKVSQAPEAQMVTFWSALRSMASANDQSFPPAALQAIEAGAANWQQAWFAGVARPDRRSIFQGYPAQSARPEFNPGCSDPYVDDPMDRPYLDWPDH